MRNCCHEHKGNWLYTMTWFFHYMYNSAACWVTSQLVVQGSQWSIHESNARDANFTSLKSRKEHALRVRMWLRTMKTLFVLHSSSLLIIYVAKYELRFLLKSDTSYKRVKFSWFKVALPMCSTIKEILENVTCRLDLFLLYEILGFKDRKRGKSWYFHALCEKHLL